MTIGELKSGDIIRLSSREVKHYNLHTTETGIVEQKFGDRSTIMWFFGPRKGLIIRSIFDNNAPVEDLVKGERKTYFQRMLIRRFFDSGLSNRLKPTEIKFQ